MMYIYTRDVMYIHIYVYRIYIYRSPGALSCQSFLRALTPVVPGTSVPGEHDIATRDAGPDVARRVGG